MVLEEQPASFRRVASLNQLPRHDPTLGTMKSTVDDSSFAHNHRTAEGMQVQRAASEYARTIQAQQHQEWQELDRKEEFMTRLKEGPIFQRLAEIKGQLSGPLNKMTMLLFQSLLAELIRELVKLLASVAHNYWIIEYIRQLRDILIRNGHFEALRTCYSTARREWSATITVVEHTISQSRPMAADSDIRLLCSYALLLKKTPDPSEFFYFNRYFPPGKTIPTGKSIEFKNLPSIAQKFLSHVLVSVICAPSGSASNSASYALTGIRMPGIACGWSPLGNRGLEGLNEIAFYELGPTVHLPDKRTGHCQLLWKLAQAFIRVQADCLHRNVSIESYLSFPNARTKTTFLEDPDYVLKPLCKALNALQVQRQSLDCIRRQYHDIKALALRARGAAVDRAGQTPRVDEPASQGGDSESGQSLTRYYLQTYSALEEQWSIEVEKIEDKNQSFFSRTGTSLKHSFPTVKAESRWPGGSRARVLSDAPRGR